MTKYFLLLSLFVFALCSNGFAQTDCSSHYFETSFLRNGYSYNSSLTLLPSGNVIMAGYADNFFFTLIKINSTGDTLWNKSYQINGGAMEDWDQTTRLDIDGTLLCALSGDQLIKIDTNGVVIWAKHVKFNGNERLYDVKVMNNGDKLLFYQATDFGSSLMARLSPDLSTVKWCKYFSFYFGSYTNIVIDNDKIVFAGSASEQIYSFTLYPFIASLDAATGNLLQFNFYKSDEFSGDIKKLYKCGNGYLGLSSFSFSDGRYAYMRFNNDLSLQSVHQFKGLGLNDYPATSFSFAPQPDGSFFLAYGGYSTLALSYISNQDSLIYVKDIPGYYSYPSDMQQSRDALYITGSDNFYNVVTQTTSSNIYLVKCDFNGSPGTCESEQYPTFTLSSYFLPIGNTTLDMKDSAMTILPITASLDVSILVQVNKNCSKDVICNSLHIKGSPGVCNTLPVTFTGSKNAGCSSYVDWSCDAKEGYTLTVISDSTVSAVFNRNGVYTLYGQINGYCGTEIIDSFKMSVNLSNQLKLGNDTFLCNNHIELHAGNQFQSYRWQDGSADSIFTVIKAGKYFVTVKDYCGNILSDTINVSQGPSYTFSAGNDTMKCNRDTIILQATSGFANYQWLPLYNIISASSEAVKVFPLQDTNYIVQAEKPVGCIVYDTVHISVKISSPIQLGNDTAFCNGESVLLQAGNSFQSYQWNTGETTANISVTKRGTYTVKAKEDVCFSYDTLVVTSVYPKPEIDLSDTTLCANGSLTLKTTSGFASYTWQDGSHLSEYEVTEPGSYGVDVKDTHGCYASDTAIVKGPAALPDHFLPADIAKCSYDTLLLRTAFLFKSYLWSNGSTSSQLTITNAATYWLQVTDNNGCTNKNYTTISDKDCKNEIYFPSAFTPNGDGHNDVFRPKVLGSLDQFDLVIYNRWGQKVFETHDWKKGWNGYISANLQDADTYIWIAAYKLKNKAFSIARGTVVLLK